MLPIQVPNPLADGSDFFQVRRGPCQVVAQHRFLWQVWTLQRGLWPFALFKLASSQLRSFVLKLSQFSSFCHKYFKTSVTISNILSKNLKLHNFHFSIRHSKILTAPLELLYMTRKSGSIYIGSFMEPWS